MTGADFGEWRTALGLSLTEAAKLLGVGRRTIMGYLQKGDLPSVVAIACRALARDKHVYVMTGKMPIDQFVPDKEELLARIRS